MTCLVFTCAKIRFFLHFLKFFSRKVLEFNNFVLPLHPQNNDGGIAQLVRAHDS